MDAAELFRCFSDATRLRVIHLLAHRGPEICVCDLVSVLNVPQGTISRHLMQLRHLNIVRDRRDGLWINYSLAVPSSKLHACLLECVRSALQEQADLRADLRRFDQLKAKACLACCAPEDCVRPETTAQPRKAVLKKRRS